MVMKTEDEYSEHPFTSSEDKNDALIPVHRRITCRHGIRHITVSISITIFESLNHYRRAAAAAVVAVACGCGPDVGEG